MLKKPEYEIDGEKYVVVTIGQRRGDYMDRYPVIERMDILVRADDKIHFDEMLNYDIQRRADKKATEKVREKMCKIVDNFLKNHE